MNNCEPQSAERLYGVAHAIELVTGNRVSPATAFRWAKRGIRGVKLRTVRAGGRRMASLAAVREFVEATTAAVDGPPPETPLRTIRARESAMTRAERELQSVGG